MKNKQLFLFLFLALSYNFLFGQSPKNLKLINSDSLVKKGIELYDKENYTEAENIFRLIPKNDSNYSIALYELCLTLEAQEKYDEAIDLARFILKNENLIYNKSQLYTLLGNTLDNAQKTEEAIKVYQTAISEFPYNYQIHYNLGVTYFKNDNLDEAEKVFFESARLNPFHQTTQFMLGLLNLKRGKLVPCVMAFNMCVILNPSSKIGFTALQNLEKLFNKELEEEIDREAFIFPEKFNNKCFDELEPLIVSNFALNKKYKVKSKIQNIIIKQNHLIFCKLTPKNNPTDLYNIYYLPFYSKIMELDFFEEFSYYIFSNTENEHFKKLALKKTSDIEKFKKWAANYIWEKRGSNIMALNSTTKYLYSNDEILISFGNFSDTKNSIKTDKWTYLTTSGSLLSYGNFKNNKKQGNWKELHYNSTINENLNYDDGNLEGYNEKFYPNGEYNIKAYFKKGKLEGEWSKFNYSGVIAEKANYKDGKIEEIYYDYFPQGQLSAETEYSSGKKNGTFKRYYEDGSLDLIASFSNNEANGKYSEYYINGNLYSEGEYKNGYQVGLWKDYYYNKQLKNEGNYDSKGRKIGKWLTYYPDGTLEQEEFYSENGKQNGTANYYSIKGDLMFTYNFKNEILTEVTSYDKNKKELGKFTEKKGVIDLKFYSPAGVVTSEGRLKDGKREGKWKFYTNSGILISEENYKGGLYDGSVINYFNNGNISSYYEYKKGEKNGLFQSYFKNGNLKQEGFYLKNQANGYWYSYNINGNTSQIDFYKADNFDGYQEEYDFFGRKKTESFYNDGILLITQYFDTIGNVYFVDSLKNGNGTSLIKDINGNILFKTNVISGLWKDTAKLYNYKRDVIYQGLYVNGRKHGLHKWYDDFGKLKSEASYRFGVEDGASILYDHNSKLYLSEVYTNGRKDKVIYYHPNEKIEIEATYFNGKKNGYTKYFSSDGQFGFQIFYNDDIPISYSYKGKDGKLINEIPIGKEQIKLVAYFSNGIKAAEIDFKNNERNGKTIYYFPSGVKKEEANYIDDEIDGFYRTWNSAGKIVEESEYSKGLINGSSKYYLDNGKLKFEENFVYGNQHGTSKYYDKNGKLTHLLKFYLGTLVSKENIK